MSRLRSSSWVILTSQRQLHPLKLSAPLSAGEAWEMLQTPPAQCSWEADVGWGSLHALNIEFISLSWASWSHHWPLQATVCLERHLVVSGVPSISSQTWSRGRGLEYLPSSQVIPGKLGWLKVVVPKNFSALAKNLEVSCSMKRGGEGRGGFRVIQVHYILFLLLLDQLHLRSSGIRSQRLGGPRLRGSSSLSDSRTL